MLVKVGFNTEFGRDKFDIGLDETDLARILAEEGIPPDARLTTVEAFMVLMSEAERFSQHMLAKRTKDEAAAERSRAASADRANILAKIKARLGVE